MALRENDISWQVLRRIVQDWAGSAAEIAEVKSLVGGCVNTTLAITTNTSERAVLKISPHRVNPSVMREAMQLKLLREVGMPVPQVYSWKIASLDDPHSYLLMEFVEGVNLAQAKKQLMPQDYDDLQRHLAELVIHLHSTTGQFYLRAGDENEKQFATWPEFYRHVYDPIWSDVSKSGVLSPKLKKQIARIHDRLDKLLAHDDRPRLVHWDIWATNILAGPDEQGKWRIKSLLDPNCKYAHAEAEIAYMELFNTITPTFLKEYQKAFKLGPSYQQIRKSVYQLYPLLNHVHLFGNGYLKPLEAAVEKVASVV